MNRITILLSFLIFSFSHTRAQKLDPDTAYLGLICKKNTALLLSPSANSYLSTAMAGDVLVAYKIVKGTFIDDPNYYWRVLSPKNEKVYVVADPDMFYEKEAKTLKPAFIELGKEKAGTRAKYALAHIDDIRARKKAEYDRFWEERKREIQRELDKKHIKDSVDAVNKKRADSVKFVKLQRQNDSMERVIIKELGPYGVILSDLLWFYESEYSYAIDVKFKIMNPTRKRIRYVWVTIAAYDAVDGRLSSMGNTTETMKGIGPIEPLESGSYHFERVFYSKVIDRIKVTKVKVQYFDGSVKTLSAGSPAIQQ